MTVVVVTVTVVVKDLVWDRVIVKMPVEVLAIDVRYDVVVGTRDDVEVID